MTSNFVSSTLSVCMLFTTPVLVNCADKPADSKPNAAADQKTAPAAAPKSAVVEQRQTSKTNTAHGLVVEGEHFITRQIQDRQQGLVLAVFQAPEKWRDQSQVVWNYAHVSNPVSRTVSVENPTNDEALFGYANARYFTTRPITVCPGLDKTAWG